MVQGACDSSNEMGPVLCTLGEVPLNIVDKMFAQEPTETAKQDR
jgi:hypothetical protein